MNSNTGQIVPLSSLENMSTTERLKYIPVKRDLTALEKANKKIAKFAPCGCGSGKKFKFCCFRK